MTQSSSGTLLPYALAAAILLVGGGVVGWKMLTHDDVGAYGAYAEVDPEYVDSEPLTEFSLATSTGGTLTSDDLQGKIWVASYFFTACPGPCLKMNKALDELMDLPEFADVKFVSITCDPPNDTPELMQKYAKQFDADPNQWYFCRGNLDYVQKIGTDLLKIAIGYQTHSSAAVVVGPKGEILGRYSLTDDVQKFALKQSIERALAATTVSNETKDDHGA